MPGITVGIDGSDGAHRALEWAMKEAAAHSGRLAKASLPRSRRISVLQTALGGEPFFAGSFRRTLGRLLVSLAC